MRVHSKNRKFNLLFRLMACLVITIFSLTAIMPPTQSYAQSVLNLPQPGVMVTTSPAFVPPVLKGLIINPKQPFQFDFVFDSGDLKLTEEEIKEESTKLIKYFLASLTMPEDELWVNLSPYEKDRIIPDEFGKTEMGRDLLAQDYLLKQLTASLIYPEEGLGKKFWDRIYEKANKLYGTSEIPVNTFNKVWIIPDKALIYENGDRAFIVETHMKVMLEEDYLALEQNSLEGSDVEKLSEVSSSIIREVIIPEIEKEVNNGKNFAKLRQIYQSFILAAWYKKNLRQSILSQKYADQKKVIGLETNDKNVKDKIYQQYLSAFEKGVYNFIKEDYDEGTQELIPRKYFSGGVKVTSSPIETQKAQMPKFGNNRHRISAKFTDPTNFTAEASSPIKEIVHQKGAVLDEKIIFKKGKNSLRFSGQALLAINQVSNIARFLNIELDARILVEEGTAVYVDGPKDQKEVGVVKLKSIHAISDFDAIIDSLVEFRNYAIKFLSTLEEESQYGVIKVHTQSTFRAFLDVLRTSNAQIEIFSSKTNKREQLSYQELITLVDSEENFKQFMNDLVETNYFGTFGMTPTNAREYHFNPNPGQSVSTFWEGSDYAPWDKDLPPEVSRTNHQFNLQRYQYSDYEVDLRMRHYDLVVSGGAEWMYLHTHPEFSPPSGIQETHSGDIYNHGFLEGQINGIIIPTPLGEELFVFLEEDSRHEEDYLELQRRHLDGEDVLDDLRKLALTPELDDKPPDGSGTSSPINSELSIDEHRKGGIDFNPNYLNVQSQGNRVEMPILNNSQQYQNIKINGLVPFIFNITPIIDIPMILGESQKQSEEINLSKVN